jgi:O-antigen/teichoic acid export membrane protein
VKQNKISTIFKNLLSASLLSAITYLVQFSASIKLDTKDFGFFQLGASFSRIVQSFNFGITDFVVAEIPLLKYRIRLNSLYFHLLVLLLFFLTIGILSAFIFLNAFLNGFELIIFVNVLSGLFFAILSFNLFFLFASGKSVFYQYSIIVTAIAGSFFLLLFNYNHHNIYLLPFVPASGVIFSSIYLFPKYLKLKPNLFFYILKKSYVFGIIGILLIMQSQIDKILMYSVIPPAEYAYYSKVFIYLFPITFIFSQVDKNIYINIVSSKIYGNDILAFWIKYIRSIISFCTLFFGISLLIILTLRYFNLLTLTKELLIINIIFLHILGYMISPFANYLWSTRRIKYQLKIIFIALLITAPSFYFIGKYFPAISYFLAISIFLQIFISIKYYLVFLKYTGIKSITFYKEFILLSLCLTSLINFIFNLQILFLIIFICFFLIFGIFNLIDIFQLNINHKKK